MNEQERCKAITKAGNRCKNRANRPSGYCGRHDDSRSEIIEASYLPPEKSLFRTIVPEEKLNPNFKLVRTAPSQEPARRMLDDVFQTFDDLDGNFLEQFQTTGFDNRILELYLFAYFSRSGFNIDLIHAYPDYLVNRDGLDVAVEATTVNPPREGVVRDLGRSIHDS